MCTVTNDEREQSAMDWIISGIGLPDLQIHANSFDEAIKQARTIDVRYSGGYVYDSNRTEAEE